MSPFRGLARVRVGADTLLLAFCGLFVAYLVLSPIAILILTSFRRYKFDGNIGFVLTLENYIETYANPEIPQAVLNTVIYAGAGTLLAVVAGTALAWVVERTNTPFRSMFTLAAAATFFVPGMLFALAWSALANPRIGTLNGILRGVFDVAEGPIDINSMGGMIWVFGTHLYPVVFLIMSAAFRSMDPSLEEAAALSGAGTWRMLRTVTLAVSRPALISGALIMFVRGLESFDVPLILGLPAGVTTLTTEIFATASLHQPPELGISASLGVILLIVSAVGVWFYRSQTAGALAFATITGKAYRPHRLDLGGMKWLTSAICMVFFFITLVLPLLALFWISLFPFVRQFSFAALQRASLNQYAYVLSYSTIVDAFRNSVINAVLVATLVVLLTSVIAWIVLRSRLPARGALDALAFAPIGIPGTIMGVAILLVYLTLPIPLYGTIFIISVAHLTLYLPYGMRLASDAIVRIHPQLEEQSALSGASWFSTYRRVLLPLLAPGLVAAWITIVAASFRELSAAIFLASPQSRFVSVMLYSTWNDGNATAAAALGIVVLFVVLLLALVGRTVGNRFRIAE
ncbi:MAG TPA: iron ABC transporter permease [Candidatus Limnocylindria bacterium]|nr:iron ABC transporter permease [Candidatus Limnocylindria bacterium]